jgi:hypothetical protein
MAEEAVCVNCIGIVRRKISNRQFAVLERAWADDDIAFDSSQRVKSEGGSNGGSEHIQLKVVGQV